jgi:3D (Asp-Asp-Asp) domain-containing protein
MTPTVRLTLLLILLWALPLPVLGQTTNALPVATDAPSYTVRPGNNLWQIGVSECGSGTMNMEIAKLNKFIKAPDYIIKPDWVLKLPAACTKNVPLAASAPAPVTNVTVEPTSPLTATDESLPKVDSAVSAIEIAKQAAPFGSEIPTIPAKPFDLRSFFASPAQFAHTVSRFITRLVFATGYCPCEICTEKPVGHPKHGRTALGDNAYVADGVAAAFEILPDLPRRARVIIPGYGVREVDDTGGDMRKNARKGIYHIDVRFSTHSQARAAFGGQGRRWVLVQILKS